MTAASSVITDRGRQIYGPTPPGAAVLCERSTPLDDAETDAVVTIIARGRRERCAVELPIELRTSHWPSVLRVMLLLDERMGTPGIGWKVGAASEEVRRAEGLPGPIPGRLYCGAVFRDGAVLGPELFINYRNVECEFAFRLAEGIDLRARPYGETEVAERIECLMPALEIGDMVFLDWYGASGYFGSCLDNGGGGILVHGPEVIDWRDLDLPNARLSLHLNDVFLKEGVGRSAMGHPLTSLTWLVNWLGERGRPLAPGEIVSTGTCTGHCFVAPGDEVRLDIEGAGQVTARFQP